MQEEVEQKTFNIVVSTTKLTARTILNAGKAAIQQQQTKMAGGKQSVRMLLRQNRGVSSVEIDKTNIRGFERYAKKYGIDYTPMPTGAVTQSLWYIAVRSGNVHRVQHYLRTERDT